MGANDGTDADISSMAMDRPKLKRTPGLVHAPGRCDDDLTPSEGRPTWFEEMINRMENTFVYVKDRDGFYMLVNDNFARQFNIVDTWKGATDATFLPEAVVKQLAINDKGVMESREDQEILEEVPFPGEGCRTFMSWKFPLYAPDGTVRAMGGISIELEMVEFLRMKTNYMHGMLKSVVESGYRIEWPRGLTMPRLMNGDSTVRRYGLVTERESKHSGRVHRKMKSKFTDITDADPEDRDALMQEQNTASDSGSGSDPGDQLRKSIGESSDSSGRHHHKNEGEMDAQIISALESSRPTGSMFGRGTVLRSDHMLYLKDESGRVLCKSKGWKTFEDLISKKDTDPPVTESEASVLREGGYLEDDEVQIMADGTFKWLHAYYFLINGTHVFSVTGLDIKMPPKSRIVCCVKSDITSTKQRINQQKDIVRALMQWWKLIADPKPKPKGIKNSIASIETFLFDTTEDEDVNTLTAPNFPLFDQNIGHRREKGPIVHHSALLGHDDDFSIEGEARGVVAMETTNAGAKRSYTMSGIAGEQMDSEAKRASVSLLEPSRSVANSIQDLFSYAIDPKQHVTNGNMTRDNSGNVTMSVDLPGHVTMSVTQAPGRSSSTRRFGGKNLNMGNKNSSPRTFPQQSLDSAVSVSGKSAMDTLYSAAVPRMPVAPVGGPRSLNNGLNLSDKGNSSVSITHSVHDSPSLHASTKGSMANILQEREQQQKLHVMNSTDSLSHHISHLGVNSSVPSTLSGGRGNNSSIAGFHSNSDSSSFNSNSNTNNNRRIGADNFGHNIFRSNHSGNNNNYNRNDASDIDSGTHDNDLYASNSMSNMNMLSNTTNTNSNNSINVNMNMNDNSDSSGINNNGNNRRIIHNPLSRDDSYHQSQHSGSFNQFSQAQSQRNNGDSTTNSTFATPNSLTRSVPLPPAAMNVRGSGHNNTNDGWDTHGNGQSDRYSADSNDIGMGNGSYNNVGNRSRAYSNDNDNYGGSRNNRFQRYSLSGNNQGDGDYNDNDPNMGSNNSNSMYHSNDMKNSHSMNDSSFGNPNNDTISAHELAANVMARMSSDHSTGQRRQSQITSRMSQVNSNSQYSQADMSMGGSHADMNSGNGNDNNRGHRNNAGMHTNSGSRSSNHRNMSDNAHSPSDTNGRFDSWQEPQQRLVGHSDSDEHEHEERSQQTQKDKQSAGSNGTGKAQSSDANAKPAARRESSLVKNELSRGKVKRPETLKQFVAYAENIAVPLTAEELNQALEKAVQFGTENVYTHRFNTGIRRIQGDTPDSLRGQFNLCQQNLAKDNTNSEKSFDIISSGTAQTWFAKFLPHIQPPGLVSRGNKGKKKK
ncbi:hypothetical protein SARC_03579 [Sphaeroforma arctica JP610]|uniref:PAS fold-4 domain-containing protein n=1 Tax=Sphaeroforma arctica JP610 TaxID=667725 RepID=A0A0L0G5H8_9EUKA|nr:hypothetical protein SARC_03579 [Sphaeroforma arctica JP610]KNC84189.1 hypothetical protein SARC_03579 [Sphaeroforma arctica JP610]|eukprot:XP_014158091.1 hypothetical protein SARC_03579 [Sphaeroforma arctica JP610]